MSVAPLGHLREDVGAQVLGEANAENLKSKEYVLNNKTLK